MRRRRHEADPGIPTGALHLCVTGVYLGQTDGERLYGSTFDPWTAFDVPLGPALLEYWHQHQHAIEAHARGLGAERPAWVLDRLAELKGWGMLR